jgi:hypothetical protein
MGGNAGYRGLPMSAKQIPGEPGARPDFNNLSRTPIYNVLSSKKDWRNYAGNILFYAM